MQLVECRMLVTLAEELNMGKAAERLFITRPALSHRLQTIEKSWDKQIFIRSQKGLSLTPSGEKIIEFAKEVVEKEDKVKIELLHLDKVVYGTLKLAVASIVAQHWLLAVLKKYMRKYPCTKISLITGCSNEMLNAVYEYEGHIGIVRGNPDWKGVKEHLLTDSLYLVDTKINCTADILCTDRPFIEFKSDSTYYHGILDWWHREFGTTPKSTIRVDQLETCKQMVLEGLGYAILPSTAIHDIKSKLYYTPLLKENGTPIVRETWLVGHESTFNLKQVKAFIDIVHEYMAHST